MRFFRGLFIATAISLTMYAGIYAMFTIAAHYLENTP